MKINKKYSKIVLALAAAGLATAAIAATLIQFDTPVVVSTDDPANNAYKAKMGWISYKSDPAVPQYDVKAQILVYADGVAGAQNIWIARSIDNGATWTQTPITTNGGNTIPVLVNPVTSLPFVVTNNKPNIYVAPLGVLDAATHTRGANTLLTWTSSDCEGSAAQLINTNLLTGPQPYMCLWAARSLDGGVTWTAQRLTDGSLDPDEDVPAGFVKYTSDTAATGGFAITYQADPTGLKQGDAEGPGDGASGATVSPGTNIWYTFLTKANFELGTAFPAPVAVSNNTGTAVGDPGASRANLALSGSTAVLAYEETKSTGAKEIIYHSFPYNTPQTNSAGTSISDPASNARRVRFVLQGNEAIGDTTGDIATPTVPNGDAADGDTAGVHSVIIWRDSASTLPDSPANIMMKRGIKNTALRPGSTGFLPTDLDATAVTLTGTSTTSNALAHRAVLRAEFAAVAYDYTANKAAADAYTATYNLFIKRSTDGGATWSAAKNMSNLTSVATRVVEPRLVGTPGTIKLPDGTATADLSDVQNRDVFFVGWGTETNAATSLPLDIYLTRTTDQGVTYETVQTLAGGVTEQSEAQLRSPPDGKTLGALWMQRDAALNTTDVMYRNGTETTVADPVVPPATTSSGGGGGCTAATGNAPFDPVLPMLAALGLIGLGARRLRR